MRILLFVIIAVIFTGGLITTSFNMNVFKEKGSSTITEQQSETSSLSPAIDLSGQGLAKVPSYIFQQTDLEKLDLSRNNLSGALQGEIRNLAKLKHIDLSNNKFTGIPAEIGQLQNLEILNISNNQITGLPFEIGNLSKLKLLDLRGNPYTASDLDLIRNKLPPTTEVITD